MTTFIVQGMQCGRCAAKINQAITALDPHAGVRIDRVAGTVSVRSHRAPAEFLAVLEGLGYPSRIDFRTPQESIP